MGKHQLIFGLGNFIFRVIISVIGEIIEVLKILCFLFVKTEQRFLIGVIDGIACRCSVAGCLRKQPDAQLGFQEKMLVQLFFKADALVKAEAEIIGVMLGGFACFAGAGIVFEQLKIGVGFHREDHPGFGFEGHLGERNAEGHVRHHAQLLCNGGGQPGNAVAVVATEDKLIAPEIAEIQADLNFVFKAEVGFQHITESRAEISAHIGDGHFVNEDVFFVLAREAIGC